MIAEAIVEVLKLLYQWIPFRLVKLDVTQQGVRFWCGKDTDLLRGGRIYFHWLWFGEIEEVTVIPKVIQTEVQGLTTKDDQNVGCSLAIHYKITDARLWYKSVDDFHESLGNLAQLHLARRLKDMTWEQLQNFEQFEQDLKEILRRRVRPWGVQILDLGFVTKTEAKAFLHLGDKPTAVVDDEE